MTHRFHLYFEPTGSSYDLLLVKIIRRQGEVQQTSQIPIAI
jgi:hypothetical protein